MSKINLLDNTRIGFLTIQNFSHRDGAKYLYNCICDCGTKIIRQKKNLLTSIKNNTQSHCGCKFSENLINQKFGKLLVIEKFCKSKRGKHGVKWKCLCECGDETIVKSSHLKDKSTVSCGCDKHHRGKNNKSFKGCGDLGGWFWSSIKIHAKNRNLEFNITQQEAWQLYLKQNKRCALTGWDISLVSSAKNKTIENHTASLDRIDSSKGYDINNVQWIHKHIQPMKLDYDEKYFINICKSIINNQYKDRPSWDEYFLMLCFDISYRSEDPDIHHGAIIVDSNNHILGTGYNATIKNSDKESIPLNIRDEKRKWMIHAEENAILNCSLNPLNYYDKCKIYVTGLPCVNCLQRIINFGIKEIIYADRVGSIKEDLSSENMRNQLINMSKIQVSKISLNNKWLQKNINN